MLGWTPGNGAVSHDVYFGVDFNDVNDADTTTSGVYRGNFPADQNYFDPGMLQKAKAYYWRVDEVVAGTFKGDVWSFTTDSLVCIKVDLAHPDCPDANIIRPETAKPGWWIWACDGWADMYRCDHCWEEGIENGPKPTGPGIAGTGIHAGITVFYEGDGGFKVVGLTSALAGSLCPTGSPVYGPICNSWYYGMDFPEGDGHSIQLALHDLRPGAYTLYSFHNHFGCYRVPGTDDPTLIRCDCFCDVVPPMPVIRAMSVKEARELPYQDQDPFQKLFPGIDWMTGPFPEGVVSLQEAYNVQPQQVTSDEELVPSVIKFTTNGNPLLVMYRAGCCQPDPIRPSRVGGRGVLNAFVLQMIPLVYAYAPSPSDGAVDVSPDVTLSWVAGEKAKWHDVYVGTSYEDVRDATTSDHRGVYVGRQELADTDYAPPVVLDYNTTYYWKVDEVNDPNMWEGDVWSFTIYQPYATNPSPADGAEEQPTEGVQLSWSPGYVAALHDVYVGTSWEDVSDADTSSSEHKSRQASSNYGIPGLLGLGRTHYWRIDEINDACAPYLWKGTVWRFMTLNYLVVDDMESYNGRPIWDTWEDTWVNGTGSLIELGIDPCNPVHGGKQSLKFDYDNDDLWGSDKYSETSRTFSDPCDWTVSGVTTLTLYFYGNPDNDAGATEQMYVGLEDSRGAGSYAEVRYGDNGEDMSDIREEEWHEWNMALADFTAVDMNSIKKMCIGFGDRSNPVPGGNGTVYFDDIRLYLPRCVPPGPYADLSGDCVVDQKDLKIMADEWLDSGSVVADLYVDSKVDFKDYAILAESWLEVEGMLP